MNRRLLVIGLDCLGQEILAASSLAELPHLRKLVESGVAGPLKSTLPPITVPAWTSMLSGRDPGELGIYGFRNRRSFAYDDTVYASSLAVRSPRLWDYVGAAGGRSIVVGVPQTSPPPAILGDLVAGFEAGSSSKTIRSVFTSPPELAQEILKVVDEYIFDVKDFRSVPQEQVLEQVYTMTEKRIRLMKHLLTTRSWDFAMLCEIAPDRLHHCFWHDHDPAHHRYDPHSPYRHAIRSYYRFLDEQLGSLLEVVDVDTAILVASDHGAQPMHGGVCINEVLRQTGWLTLKEEPTAAVPLKAEMVDWSRTKAWGDGGYYARIFLNIQGREPQGTLPIKERNQAREELRALFATLQLPDTPLLHNQVVRPEEIYQRVRGLPPDLLIFFAGLSWRSLGSVGHKRTWLVGNDTGVDEANHAQYGLYALAGPRIPSAVHFPASILDIAPTVLAWMGLPPLENASGQNILSRLERIP